MVKEIKSLLQFFFLCFCISLQAQVEDYTWKNVPIGGGGYITGMKIHPLDATKRYYRTDVGGAYRWNEQTGWMEQLIYLENDGFYSTAGIALHPTDTQKLWLSVGRKCSPSNNAILYSDDAGATVRELVIPGGVPFHFAANGGRDCETGDDNNAPNTGDKDRQGTPLAINPYNTNQLFIGTRERGLYILELDDLNLIHISSNQIPHNTEQYSIRSVEFHPTQPYVYIGYAGHGVFIGDLNAGTFENVDPGNQFPELNNVLDISISKNGDYMLLACERDGILKANLQNPGNPQFQVLSGYNSPSAGYLTVDCSPHDNDMAITVAAGWHHIDEFQVTTNAGNSWSEIRGRISNNIFPWRETGFASHVAQIAFSPSDPTEMHYTSWFGTFQCNNFSINGTNEWSNFETRGHEEIVPTEIVALPSNSEGNFLMVGSGDHSGFLFDDKIEDPNSFATTDISHGAPNLGSLRKSSSMDFCESNPDNMIVCISREWTASDAGVLRSTDGGLNWTVLPGYDQDYQKSIIAMSSSNPDDMIFLNNTSMMYTGNGGQTINNSTGTTSVSNNCNIPFALPCKGASNLTGVNMSVNVFAAGRNITADRSLGCVFYFYDWDGSFHISTDGGEEWCIMNSNTLPSTSNSFNRTRLVSVSDHPGHLWININNQLWHSTNGGANWTNYTAQFSVNVAAALSFGKGVTASYPSLYIYGTVDGNNSRHVYRSDDRGINWIRVTNHGEREIWGDIKMMAGDRNVAGRVHATVSGQGVVFGEAFTNESCDNTEKTIEGEFDQLNMPNVPHWVDSQNGGASMTATTNAYNKAVLDITNPGTFNYDLQLWQDNLSMEAGKQYVIETDLRADDDRQVTIRLRNRANPITYLNRDISIGSDAKEIAFLFLSTVNDNDLRLTLQVGGNAETVYVDHIRFREFCTDDHALLSCIDELIIDDELSTSGTFKVNSTIESSATLYDSASINYEAGSAVLLENQFEVESGVVFVAEIKACMN